MYFLGNTKKDIYAEDLLVLYVRILEGYHLRITNVYGKIKMLLDYKAIPF